MAYSISDVGPAQYQLQQQGLDEERKRALLNLLTDLAQRKFQQEQAVYSRGFAEKEFAYKQGQDTIENQRAAARDKMTADYYNRPPAEKVESLSEKEKAIKAVMDRTPGMTYDQGLLAVEKMLRPPDKPEKPDKLSQWEQIKSILDDRLKRGEMTQAQYDEAVFRISQPDAMDELIKGQMGGNKMWKGIFPKGNADKQPTPAVDPLEGKTATGPGGVKIKRVNGKWVPIK
jgi:hypothetical protein